MVLVSDNVIYKTLDATTQLALHIESDNRSTSRCYYKSRFPFFKHKRLNDEFHTGIFYPDYITAQRHKCIQIFSGKYTGYWKVHQMRREANALLFLQDFAQSMTIPPVLKWNNARTQVGEKQTSFERQIRINRLFTEAYSPWQNIVEHSINDLDVMVQQCMKHFKVPLN